MSEGKQKENTGHVDRFCDNTERNNRVFFCLRWHEHMAHTHTFDHLWQGLGQAISQAWIIYGGYHSTLSMPKLNLSHPAVGLLLLGAGLEWIPNKQRGHFMGDRPTKWPFLVHSDSHISQHLVSPRVMESGLQYIHWNYSYFHKNIRRKHCICWI